MKQENGGYYVGTRVGQLEKAIYFQVPDSMAVR